MNEKRISSVETEESVGVVEGVGSSQGEFVTQVAGAEEREFPTKTRDDPLEKLERCEEEARLESPESVSIETACVAADLGVQSSVFCRDFSKAGGKRYMPGECSTITADEADEYVDVVGNTNPVHSDMEPERFTFRESVSHAFLNDLGGFLILLAFPCLKFNYSHLHSVLAFLGRVYILATM